MEHFATWKSQIEKLYQVYSNFCEGVDYSKSPIAKEEKVTKLEATIGCTIPKSLRETFLLFSRKITFTAFLPEEFEMPTAFEDIFSANFKFSLFEIENAEEMRRDLIDSMFTNKKDEHDKVWHNKLAFMTVGNGDMIAFDLDDPSDDKRVVYLSAAGEKSHGMLLGKNFKEYFSNLLSIGACGSEDFQMMPFINETSGLDATSERAKIYRKLIKLKWDD